MTWGTSPSLHIRSLWGQRATLNSEGGMKRARLAWGVTTSKSSGLGAGDQCVMPAAPLGPGLLTGRMGVLLSQPRLHAGMQ